MSSKETVCDVSSVNAAALVLGGGFRREDCGFFESCSHNVEEFDGQGAIVELTYCAIDWYKVGPLIALFVILVLYIWYKIRRARQAGEAVSSMRSRYSGRYGR
jgi:hypothetical protein